MPKKNSKKRRQPEGCKGNKSKRRKIDDAYDSDLCSDMMQLTISDIVQNTQRVFESESYQESEVYKFASQLIRMSDDYLKKITDLKYSNDALSNLLETYEKKVGRERIDSDSDEESSSDIELLHEPYFSWKIHDFIKENVLMLRNLKDHERNTQFDTDYESSVDIAMKSSKPHSEYKQIMHELLKEYIGGINGISSIICDYSHNGYIWYYFCFLEEEDERIERLNNRGIMSKLEFHPLDYFKYLGCYHKNKSINGRRVTFDSLRKRSGLDGLQQMKDKEIALFIWGISSIVFEFDDKLEDIDGLAWIQRTHR